MPRVPDPKVRERNQRLVEAARANPFLSDTELGEQFGLKFQRVRQVLSDAGVINADRRRNPHKTSAPKERSNLHVMIGTMIEEQYVLRLEEKPKYGDTVVSSEVRLRKIAEELRYTVQTLNRVRQGMEPLPLSEIQRIAAWMNKTPAQLLLDAEKRLQRVCVQPASGIGKSAV